MQVFEATATNLTEIGDYMDARPEKSLPGMLELFQAKLEGYGNALFGDLPQVAEGLQHWAATTLPAGLQTAFELAASGEPEAAARTVQSTVMSLLGLGSPLMGMMDFIVVPNQIMQDVVDIAWAITAPIQLLSLVTPVANLAWSPLLSVGITAQKAVDAVEAGDALGVLGAVLNAPADAVDHFLNARGGLVEFRMIGSTGTLTSGGLLTSLLVKIPQSIMTNLAPPVTPAAATSVALPGVTAGKMVSLPTSTLPATEQPADTSVAAQPTEVDPASAETDSTAGLTESDATPAEDDDGATAKVKSNSAKGLSTGNKAEPGEIGTTSTRRGQQLRTSLENAANQFNGGLNDIRDGIEKSVAGLKDRNNKAPAGKAARESTNKQSKNKNGAGTSSSSSDS
ncbi:hypothetical protein A5733_19980 [Mycobacterium sp. NS-7484]|nr:hypothetical protein A5733_19980 [Mycobacterium sp. NS-7484]